MKKLLLFLLFVFSFSLYSQSVEDDFEGNGTINSWAPDDCGLNTAYNNPVQQGTNTSAKVLRYHDTGGQYANIRFDTWDNFDFSTGHTFSLKIYVPSSGLTGSQNNQISLKLQDGTLGQPWTTQSEVIKNITLNQWQTVTFDFLNDNYINLDGGSPPPTQRNDFNRVLLQVNGEDNTDQVIAYIDDFYYDGTIPLGPVYDTLVWQDEFDGLGAIDTNKWFHQTQFPNGDSWFNGEQQAYTNSTNNSGVSSGTLKIVALKENVQGKEYSSARLNSKFAFKYGRVEVRAKLPSVAGTWPAIWLLGKNITESGAYWETQGYGTTGWPWCGEIDIMEPNIDKTLILGTWHWDNGSGYQYNSASVPLSNSEASQNWHVYALEWNEDDMKVYLDDILVNQMPTIDPFNEEFYILLNVAMGGGLGGPIDPSFTSDQMEIDYVRIYQRSALSVDEVEKKETIKVSPNPVRDQLNIELKNNLSENVDIKLIDINGRVVGNDSFKTSASINYNTSHLHSGFYFAHLTFSDGTNNVLKFLKQ
ncbi:MAG: family 16 glycosylhydrolase [Winogradskyella sp.]|nr:family 16 glycosylhydrolase [Winogradskyella sp.]